MILRVLFELFLLYLAYKLIFDFIIPIYQTTKQVKKKMGEMQQQMNRQQEQQFQQHQQPTQASSSKTTAGDYIDFEEVK